MNQFESLGKALTDEMLQLLPSIANDPDNFGFALAVPTDYGSACIFYAVGKDSALGPHGKHSLSFIYSPVQWVQDWSYLPKTNAALEEIVELFRQTYSTMTDGDEKDRAHDDFISDCAYCCLEVLEKCNRDGLFGNIWFKVLDMSDEKHPAVVESFRRLNSGKVLDEGAEYFND